MKYYVALSLRTTIYKRFSYLLSILLLTLNTGFVSAISIEEGKETFTWEMYQRNAAHTGYIPISLNINGTEARDPGFNSASLVTHALPGSHGLTLYHNSVANAVDGTFFYILPKLNQATITKDFIFATNRGYRAPHFVYIMDRTDGGNLRYVDYLSIDTEIGYAGTTGYWPETHCPSSQGQPVFYEDVIFFVGNYYNTSVEEGFCQENLLSEQVSIFRSHIFEADKSGAGVQDYTFWAGPAYHTPIQSNIQDEFLGATLFDGKLYTQGGGLQQRRGYSGVYAFENTINTLTALEQAALVSEGEELPPVLIENLWEENPNFLNYPRLAPNNRWTPAVNDEYVITFTNGYVLNDYSDNIGELNVLDRATGDILFTITIDNFAPEDPEREYFMDNAPVLVNSNSVILINNDRLINFNLRTREVEWSIEDGFYGQPSVSTSENTIYAASDDDQLCGGANLTCIVGVTAEQNPILVEGTDTRLLWVAPGNANIRTPFVLTDSHIFVSTDDGITYGISTSTAIANGARQAWDNTADSGGIAGQLSFAYNTLYIAHYADDTLFSGAPSIIQRPTISTSDHSFATLDLDAYSYITAYPFDIDLSVSSDLAISVVVDADDDPSAAGDQARIEDSVVFTVTTTNNGQLTATSPVVTAEVPFALTLSSIPSYCTLAGLDLTCDLSTELGEAGLAVGESHVFTVSGSPTAVGTLTFEFSVDSEKLDPIASNDVTVTVFAIAASPTVHNLSISITPEDPTANLNGTIFYNLSVSNAGPDIATAISVSISSSEFEEFLTGSLPSTCATTSSNTNDTPSLGDTITCSIDSLLSSNQTTVLRIPTTAIAAGIAQISASASSNRTNATDSDGTNNSNILSSTVTISESSVAGATELPTGSGGSIGWLGLLLLLLRFRLKTAINQ